MINRYNKDANQLTLDNLENINSRKNNLENHRMILYKELKSKLQLLDIQKKTLINNYKVAVSEIDRNLQSLNKGDIKKN